MKTLLNRIFQKRVPSALALLLAFSALFLPREAFAQAPGNVPVVREVIVKFTGVATVTEDIVRANMSLREGMPYDETIVDRDIRSLYRRELMDRFSAFAFPPREFRPGGKRGGKRMGPSNATSKRKSSRTSLRKKTKKK